MDIKKYEVMLCVADEGSFLRAGEKMGYTQSGITQMMNSMENELGFPLFIRGNRGVNLTREGKRLLPKLRELLHMNQIIEQECAEIRGVEAGSVSIGSFTSMSIHWVPAIIERFQQLYPNVHVEMLENGDADELEGWLQEGRIDMCFYSLMDDSPFDQIELLQDELYAILPKGHKMQDYEKFPVEAFADDPFLLYQSSNGADRDIEAVLKRGGLKPRISFTSNFDYCILSMAEHNLGISILPYLILQGKADNVVAKPLDPPASRRLGIAVRSMKSVSPAAKKLIDCAREVVGNEYKGKKKTDIK